MSVLIENMELPKNCYDCPFAMQDYTTLFGNNFKQTRNSYACVLTHKTITSTKRNRFCPLILVPPHGRLIDENDFFSDDIVYPDKLFEKSMREFVSDMPTIIEAEEGEI